MLKKKRADWLFGLLVETHVRTWLQHLPPAAYSGFLLMQMLGGVCSAGIPTTYLGDLDSVPSLILASMGSGPVDGCTHSVFPKNNNKARRAICEGIRVCIQRGESKRKETRRSLDSAFYLPEQSRLY